MIAPMTENSFDRCRLDRTIIRLSGPDRVTFLQGLTSCDIIKAVAQNAVYGAFLTPQGKFLHDFFCLHPNVGAEDGTLLIDIRADRADDFLRRLRPFRLRSKIEMTIDPDLAVWASPVTESGTCYPDPRTPIMGWRCITPNTPDTKTDTQPYHDWRIKNGIPEAVDDLIVEQTILLEGNLDLLHGIDWQKGCYMGQEVTARTHYRGLIKKRLFPCRIDGPALPHGTILYIDDREIGDVRSGNKTDFIACLRVDLVKDHRALTIQTNTGTHKLEIKIPAWLAPMISGIPIR